MVKKKKIAKTNAMRMLDKMKFSYEVHEYPWSEDHLDAVSVLNKMSAESGAVYKTLVAVGDKTGVVVGVIPAQKELDLKAFAKVSGNKRIEMLPVKDLEETTGYIRGGCSPIGMKKSYPTFLSHHVSDEDKILVSGGKRGTQIALTPSDLVAVTHGKVETITQEKEE
ncbi:prolyl-trna editing protein ybak/ebsc [Trichococcus palustris]|uniref:Cys-tRNA(Pro)/Cys-tRNA(Cys) deacylase n=1 Tax=Trichococcus palustris TaxID=140314 RepID=A0A143YRL5_9LACT|nr:Cys-tRNA(Pro) deacylase [Trichococcus palustris]CZQ95904.1 prolyl-trna editing protein ybak/ebsc [Trichococcus palustris]SFK97583.1 Cys-tRNA(Pro)/Cys-tRNA(Cys) deacylase [Trichococcus palustris]